MNMKKLLNILKALIIIELVIVIALIIGSIIISYSNLIPIIIMLAIIPVLSTLIFYKAVKDHIPKEISREKIKINHQNSYSQFIVFYNRLKNYSFDEVEESRKLLKKSKMLFITIQTIIIVAYIIFCIVISIQCIKINLHLLSFILAIPYTLIFIFYKSKINKMQQDYNTEYKEKIIKLVVKNYNDKFEYTPYIDERKNRETYDYLTKIYSHSKTVNPDTTDYELVIDDYILYKNDDYSMKVFNIYYGGGRISNKANVFVEITTNALLNNEIILVTKNIEDDLCYLPEGSIQISSGDEELDKYFYTYSKRKFENMDILDKDLKQELKIAYENTSRGFIFRITQNKIYINFRTENIFDDNIFSKFLNEKTLLEQYCLLDSIYKLANNTVRIVKKIDNKNLYK